MNSKRRPWGKWYWSDWRGDTRLHRCSYAARGLWKDMLSVMGGEAEHFGFLMVEGEVWDAAALAEQFGGTTQKVHKMLQELERFNVFSRTGSARIPPDILPMIPDGLPSGIIFNRRMVRDLHKENMDRENGKAGGNPNLKGGVKGADKAQRLDARDKNKKEDAGPKGPAAIAASGSKDDQTWIFNEGLQWLAGESGRSEKALRSFIGKCLKTLKGDAGQLRLAIEEASRQPKLADATEWVAAAVKARGAAQGASVAAPRGFAPRQAQPSMAEALDAAQEQLARVFANTGMWPPGEGPKPGERGCRLPPEVLARYGLRPFQDVPVAV